MIDNGMGNDEIIAILAENGIEVSAEPVIIDITDTVNPDYKAVFMLAEIKLASQNSSLTKAQMLLKNWGTSKLMLRSIESVAIEVADELQVGQVLEGMTFRVIDELTPSHDRHTPRQTKDGRMLLTEDGEQVYRSAVIIDVEELNGDDETEGIGHSLIKCKPDGEAATEPEEPKEKAAGKAGKGLGAKKPAAKTAKKSLLAK